MGQGNITIEDVGKAAGVSRQTVSRVINQKTNVSAAARERVETAIEELGYVPNIAARRMGGARSYVLLALIERNAARAAGGHLPLNEMLLAGIDACSIGGYHLLFDQIDAIADRSGGRTLSQSLNPILSAVQPDGVIVMPPLDQDTALQDALSKRGVASAYLGERIEKGRKVPGLDEAAFAEAAAQRLIALGHRQIGFVAGVTEGGRSGRRIEGYRRTLARSRSRAHRRFVADGAHDYAAALEIARNWLVPTIRPTAIIAETPEVALAFLHVAGELNLAVPRELSLLALADSSALALSKPPISALHQPYGAMFARACEQLMAASAGLALDTKDPADDEQSDNKTVTAGYEFTARASLAKAPRAV